MNHRLLGIVHRRLSPFTNFAFAENDCKRFFRGSDNSESKSRCRIVSRNERPFESENGIFQILIVGMRLQRQQNLTRRNGIHEHRGYSNGT